jgi:hypothetical protein
MIRGPRQKIRIVTERGQQPAPASARIAAVLRAESADHLWVKLCAE